MSVVPDHRLVMRGDRLAIRRAEWGRGLGLERAAHREARIHARRRSPLFGGEGRRSEPSIEGWYQRA